MGRRSPQSVLKRAREQALREKREMKQAKKDARAAARLNGEDPFDGSVEAEAEAEAEAVAEAEEPAAG
jgi:hypothetical protein